MHKVGHRGTPLEFPANTMCGFARAVELGCTMVECDVRLSLDGRLALVHDDHVIDKNDISYLVAEYPMSFLAALDLGAGEGVPTLEQLAVWSVGKCAVMADMKCSGGDAERSVTEALYPLSVDQKIVPGADFNSRECFREADPLLPLSFSTDKLDNISTEEDFSVFVANLDTCAVTWHYSLLTPSKIDILKAAHLQVYAWTVDSFAEMRRLQDDGVDGIISNRADLLRIL